MGGAGIAEPLRVATYNVQGRLWGARPEGGPARVLEEIGADVVALQEVHPPESLPTVWEPPGGGEAYHVVYGQTLIKMRGPFGNALLSRHPIVDVKRHDLSHGRREPRGALDVMIDWDGRQVRCIAMHLGLRRAERLQQVERLLDEVGHLGECLCVLLGDLNEWRRGAALARIERAFGAQPCVRTFPARLPVLALDRIYTLPREALLGLAPHCSKAARSASDHLPVVATVAAAC